jgi:hypothetical protein
MIEVRLLPEVHQDYRKASEGSSFYINDLAIRTFSILALVFTPVSNVELRVLVSQKTFSNI